MKNKDVCSNLDISEKKDRAISMKEIERNVVYSCHEHFAGYKRVLCSTISHTVCKFPLHFPLFCVSVSKSRQLYFQLSDAPFIHQLARARAGLNQISQLKMTFILISPSV